MIRLLIRILICILFTTPCFAAYNVWLDNSLTKYRQDGEDGTSGSSSLSITMAKNEIESFQAMIYADGETLTGVNVTVSNLTKGSDTLDDIYLYKQHYHMTASTDVKGVVGDWEDQGSNIWRKNIGATTYVWQGTPSSYHDQEVGFYTGGTGQANWSDGDNTSILNAISGTSLITITDTNLGQTIVNPTTISVEFPVSTSLASQYWTFNHSNGTYYYVWYTVNSVGSNPSLSGKTGILVALATGDSANEVATKTATAITSAGIAIDAPVANIILVPNVTQCLDFAVARKWQYDGTYLHVYAPSNPATYYTEIHAPNRKSRVDYPSGMYPDALLPKVDRYFGETRNTFPFTVASGKLQGVWVDIGTTTTTPAGNYTGTVTVSADGKSDVVLNINVVVKDFSLPSTPTFHTQFVFEQSMMTFGHGMGQAAAWNGTQPAIDLAHTYMTAFLYHKMGANLSGGKSMVGKSYMPWDSGSKKLSVVNWEPWYSIVKDAFNGTAITSGPYTGGKFAMKRVPSEWPTDSTSRTDIATADKETAARQYAQIVYDKFQDEGWDPWNTLIFGTFDEPRCDQTVTWRGTTWNKCDAVIDQAEDINAIDTGGNGVFKRIYTNSKMRPGLEGFADHGFYSANTYTFVCPGWDKTCTSGGTKVSRDTYPGYPNDEMWGYLACDNNSCWQTGPVATTGQVDWSADASALYNRLPGFVWAKYELTGTIYWQTTYDNYYGPGNTSSKGAPYDQIFVFGSNGDGHLIYPGVASAMGRTLPASTPIIGGTHDIPIESIRMKHIRDAIEDWEYVHAAKSVAGAADVAAALNRAFTDADILDAYWSLGTADDMIATREALGDILSGALPPAAIRYLGLRDSSGRLLRLTQ